MLFSIAYIHIHVLTYFVQCFLCVSPLISPGKGSEEAQASSRGGFP